MTDRYPQARVAYPLRSATLGWRFYGQRGGDSGERPNGAYGGIEGSDQIGVTSFRVIVSIFNTAARLRLKGKAGVLCPQP